MRKELGIEIEMVHGHYGEFRVLVDEQTVVDGGALAVLGILPSAREVVKRVSDRLGSGIRGEASSPRPPD